ncbi:MAG: hypothetical protein ACI8V2_000837 [Candidatus Latescibacterota bacterium]|jgi:uncharacterized protein (DUF433 family)
MLSQIEINPNIHFGKPCITGTRIPVTDVLLLISEGISFETILNDYYPSLSNDDIRACVRYAIEIVGAEDIHITETK